MGRIHFLCDWSDSYSLDSYLRLILLGLILLAFGLRIVLILQPIRQLLKTFLADDAYYYYVLARNISQGNGAVFNQGIPTNGFHPLYTILLLPVFGFLFRLGLNVPVYVSLGLLSVVTVATAIPLYKIGEELHSRTAGLLTAFLWLFNPYVLFISLSGVETPLQTFSIAVLVWYLLAEVDRPAPTYRQAAVVGGLVALAFLSRMDSVFIAIGVFVALMMRSLRGNVSLSADNRDRLIARLAPVFTGGVIASVLVAPWIFWSILVVGRITPVSGAALRLLRHDTPVPYWKLMLRAMGDTGGFVWEYFFYHLFGVPSSELAWAWRILVALGLLILMLAVLRQAGTLRTLVSRLDFLVIGGIPYYLFYWFYQLEMRPWYGLLTSLVLSLLLALVLAELVHMSPSRRRQLGRFSIVVLVFTGLFTISGVVHYSHGSHPEAATKWEAANYIRTERPNASVGSFNTGIYQYYTPDHDVINLDGVMNPEAYRARKSGSLSDYVCENRIEYVLDPPSHASQLRPELELNPVHQILSEVRTSNARPYILYRVRGC